MSDFVKRVYDDIHGHPGLGSSTFGQTMDEHNKGRTEAEVLEARRLGRDLVAARLDRMERERIARVSRGEPEDYHINAWWDSKSGKVETFFHETLPEVYEEITEGIRDCQYLYTIRVSKTNNRTIRNVGAFNIEDEARAWARAEGK